MIGHSETLGIIALKLLHIITLYNSTTPNFFVLYITRKYLLSSYVPCWMRLELVLCCAVIIFEGFVFFALAVSDVIRAIVYSNKTTTMLEQIIFVQSHFRMRHLFFRWMMCWISHLLRIIRTRFMFTKLKIIVSAIKENIRYRWSFTSVIKKMGEMCFPSENRMQTSSSLCEKAATVKNVE